MSDAAPATPGNFQAAMSAISSAEPAAPAATSSTAEPAVDTSTQTVEPSELETSVTEPAPELEQLEPEAATDPLDEQIHGMSARELLDALRKGELPDALARQLKRKIQSGDETEELSIDELERRGMRLSDYRRKTAQHAEAVRQTEDMKGKVRQLFDQFEKPEGFARVIDTHGLGDNARAYVTRGWGTEQQPNVRGFIEDMHRLGHWNTFQAAADHYAAQYAQMLEAFAGGPQNLADPNVAARAEAMVRQWQDRERDMMRRSVETERTGEALRRKQAQLERSALLQANPQAVPQIDPQTKATIEGSRAQAFEHFGLKAGDSTTESYFTQSLAAVMRKPEAKVMTMNQIMHQASADTADWLREEGLLAKRPTAPEKKKPDTLPAKRTASPSQVAAAPGIKTARTGGSPADFGEYTRRLQNAGR